MPFLTANGVRPHWRQDGDTNGAAVIFANSLGADLRLWEEVIALMPAGLRLIHYDKRGPGLSDAPFVPFSIQDLTNDVKDLLHQIDGTSCNFIGTSVGGMIGQNLAARRPDLIRKLVLTNTAAKMGMPAQGHHLITLVEAGGIIEISDAVLVQWFGPVFLARNDMSAWHNMLIQTCRESYVGFCKAIALAELTTTTASLQMTSSVFAGTDDQASPPDVVRAIADMISGSQFHSLAGVGHLPSVEIPDALAHIITAFVQEGHGA